MDETNLSHAGVKGMKWGVRKHSDRPLNDAEKLQRKKRLVRAAQFSVVAVGGAIALRQIRKNRSADAANIAEFQKSIESGRNYINSFRVRNPATNLSSMKSTPSRVFRPTPSTKSATVRSNLTSAQRKAEADRIRDFLKTTNKELPQYAHLNRATPKNWPIR